jgi:D-alanine-D-alanine ligase
VPRVSNFFDYKAKYEEGGSLEITPPENLSSQEMKTIRSAALHAHFLIGASGFSRTDMIMDKKGTVYVLEINTIPGLTKESLIPKAAAASGMSFSDLLDTIVHAGFTRWGRKK